MQEDRPLEKGLPDEARHHCLPRLYHLYVPVWLWEDKILRRRPPRNQRQVPVHNSQLHQGQNWCSIPAAVRQDAAEDDNAEEDDTKEDNAEDDDTEEDDAEQDNADVTGQGSRGGRVCQGSRRGRGGNGSGGGRGGHGSGG